MRNRRLLLILAFLLVLILAGTIVAEKYYQSLRYEGWEVHNPNYTSEFERWGFGGDIFVDSHGRIYVSGTAGCMGICIYDGSIWTTSSTPDSRLLSENNDRQIWLLSDHIIVRREDDRDQTLFDINDITYHNLDRNDVISIDVSDTIWGGYGRDNDPSPGLSIINSAGITYYTNSNSALPEHGSINEISFDLDGNAWVATTKDLILFDHQTHESTRLSVPNSSEVYKINFSPSGAAWLRTSDGLTQLGREGWRTYPEFDSGSFESYAYDNDAIDFDPEGQPWIGTVTGAVMHYNGQKWLVLVPPSPYGCCRYAISDIAVDKTGRAWIATEDGLLVIEADHTTLLTPYNSPLNLKWVDAIDIDLENHAWVSTLQLIMRTTNINPSFYNPSKDFLAIRDFLFNGSRWLWPILAFAALGAIFFHAPEGVLFAIAFGFVLLLLVSFPLGMIGAVISTIGVFYQVSQKHDSSGYQGAAIGAGITIVIYIFFSLASIS